MNKLIWLSVIGLSSYGVYSLLSKGKLFHIMPLSMQQKICEICLMRMATGHGPWYDEGSLLKTCNKCRVDDLEIVN